MSVSGSVINSSIAKKAVNVGKKGLVLARKYPKMALATGVATGYMLGHSTSNDNKKGSLGKLLLTGLTVAAGLIIGKRYCKNKIEKFLNTTEIGRAYVKIKDCFRGMAGKLGKLPTK